MDFTGIYIMYIFLKFKRLSISNEGRKNIICSEAVLNMH